MRFLGKINFDFNKYFFYVNNTYSDNMIATGLGTQFFHFVKGDTIHEQKFYIINNINGNNNPIVSLTNSGYTRIQNSGNYGTKMTYHDSVINSITGSSKRIRLDYYDGTQTIYLFYITSTVSPTYNYMYVLLINNVTGEYYNYFLDNSLFGYGNDPFRSNFRFLSLNNKLIFYSLGGKFFTPEIVQGNPILNISDNPAPEFINPIITNNISQYVRGEGNNTIRTCSLNNGKYNYYAWNDIGATSNHSSIDIPTAFGKNYTNTTSSICTLYYLPLNNVTFFSQFSNNQSFSSFYIPGQGFSTENLEFGYYIYAHNIYNDTYNYVNLGNNPRIFNIIVPNPGIGPFANYSSTGVLLGEPYMIYQLSTEVTNFYSTANIVPNNLNTPTLSGTTITGNSNNSIINNNNNNVNLNPTITNTVNIPGVCPFGKKLSPIRWTDGLYYCQVDEGFSCPYGNATPVFFLDGFYCEIPKQDGGSEGTGVLIPDYTNIINNSGSINNSNFGTGTIEGIIGGGVYIGNENGVSGLFNTTISGSTNKTNNCSTIISGGIFQYSIGKNNNFFQIKLENVDTEKMLGEANGWKLEFFGVNFLKPLYGILDFFGNFTIKIYNHIANNISGIIDIFGYLFNSIQRNKYYCFLGEEYYIYSQTTEYKSLLDNTMKNNNGLIDIIVIVGVIITNLILLIKLKNDRNNYSYIKKNRYYNAIYINSFFFLLYFLSYRIY